MTSTPNWVHRPPQAYDIVTGFFPETSPEGGTPKCRPLLVTQTYRVKGGSNRIVLRVAYGTSLKKAPHEYDDRDLVIYNSSELNQCGLLTPTRFVCDPSQQTLLEWNQENFCTWSGETHPRRGALSNDMQREYAWVMTKYL